MSSLCIDLINRLEDISNDSEQRSFIKKQLWQIRLAVGELTGVGTNTTSITSETVIPEGSGYTLVALVQPEFWEIFGQAKCPKELQDKVKVLEAFGVRYHIVEK